LILGTSAVSHRTNCPHLPLLFETRCRRLVLARWFGCRPSTCCPNSDQLVPVQITDYSLGTKFLPDQQSQSQTKVFSAPRWKIYFPPVSTHLLLKQVLRQ
jgi:hypothetical protein